MKIALLAAAAALLSVPLPAQQRTLAPGDVVRLSAPGAGIPALQGEVVSYHPGVLTVRWAGRDTVLAIPLPQIRSLARREGRSRGRATRRALTRGAFLGFAVGVVAGPLLAAQGRDEAFTRTTLLTAVGGLAVGAGVGAGTGALSSGESWQRFLMSPGAEPCPACAAATAAPAPAAP